MRVRLTIIVVVAALSVSSCTTHTARATWLPDGEASAAARRGLAWLRTQPDPGGSGLTELASVLDSVARRAGRPRELRWVDAVTIRARARAGHSADPQEIALTRLLGDAPTPAASPAVTTANTINKLLAIALWCDAYPTPAGYDAALAAAPGGTAITVVAAAGASQLLLERGCRSRAQLETVRASLAAALGRLARRMPIGDSSLQVGALLGSLGREDLVPPTWISRVIQTQRRDGSWPAGTAPGSSREPWRATAWAVRALIEHQLPSLPAPSWIPDGRTKLTPSPAVPAAPPLLAGSLSPEDRQALNSLSVQTSDPITEPSGGTPFGQHSDHDHESQPITDPEVQHQLDRELAAARAAAGTLRRKSDAVDVGYVLGSAFIPTAGAHWMKWSLVDQPFDAGRPSMILFDGDRADANLVAFSYVLRSAGQPPVGFAGGTDHWHQHFAICFANGRLVGSDILSAGDCAVLGLMTSSSPESFESDLLAGDDLWMLHAWIVPDHANAQGVFTSSNPEIQCGQCAAWLPGRELR